MSGEFAELVSDSRLFHKQSDIKFRMWTNEGQKGAVLLGLHYAF